MLLTKAVDRACDTPECVVLENAVAGGGAVGWAGQGLKVGFGVSHGFALHQLFLFLRQVLLVPLVSSSFFFISALLFCIRDCRGAFVSSGSKPHSAEGRG